jgi:hypothetical protein
MHAASSCCLVAIGRLQVSSSPHWSPPGQFLTPIGCLWVGCLVTIGRLQVSSSLPIGCLLVGCLGAIGRLQVSSLPHWSPSGKFLTPIGCLWSASLSPLVAFRSVPHPHWLHLARLPCRHWPPSDRFLTPIGCLLVLGVGCLVFIGRLQVSSPPPHWSFSLSAASSPLVAVRSVPHLHWLSLCRLPCRH